MSDVREAFEALERVEAALEQAQGRWYSPSDINKMKAALESQTAPAVPEGWKLVPVEPTKTQLYAAEIVSSLNHETARAAYSAMLTAAPQPDHSPDAGKVVQGKNRYGLDMGYFSRLIAREFGDLSNFRPDEFARVCARMAATADASVLQEKEFRVTPAADGGEVEPVGAINPAHLEILSGNKGSSTVLMMKHGSAPGAWPRLYTHPAQPRNEVQAEALEAFADSASPNNEAEDVIVRKAYDAAARLRSNGGDVS